MSADVLQRLTQDGALTVHTLADLFNIQPHSVYPYLTNRELRYGHVRTLCRRAHDPRVAAAIYDDLMAGTGWSAIYIDGDLDIDGDGDVDTDDVMGHAIDALDKLSTYLKTVRGTGKPDMALLGQLTRRVIQGVVTSERCAQHIADQHARRRKARPLPYAAGGVR